MNTEETTAKEFTGEATYCPEDNKLRLYVGRVPREEYLKLRAEGWTALPKQRETGGGDFAAIWTPARRDTALEYAGFIGDEDKGPEERAADRAERFSGYRDKRTVEACGHADRYETGPSAHGFQSQARAERAAARHDRIATRAGDSWSKAEYWTRRTAGVIGHALYKSTPGVRMGRIKIIEADLRRIEKQRAENAAFFESWRDISTMTDATQQNAFAKRLASSCYGRMDYTHPRTGKTGSLWEFIRDDAADRITGAEAAALYLAAHADPKKPEWNETRSGEWVAHYNLRLAYENQMCEAAGGRAALVEMVPGGFVGSYQIRKVCKSPVTGLVVSVEVMGTHTGYTKESGYTERATRPAPVLFNIERLTAEAYRPPTAEELTAFKAAMKAEKAAKPKAIKPPLINPTDADAERLQAVWNERERAAYAASMERQYGASMVASCLKDWKPSTVCRITQAAYSANSKGSYARAETKEICWHGVIKPRQYFHSYEKQAKDNAERGPVVCELRTTSSDGHTYGAKRVIVLTDKAQKTFPAEIWQQFKPAESVIKSLSCALKLWVCGCGHREETSKTYDCKVCPNCNRLMRDEKGEVCTTKK